MSIDQIDNFQRLCSDHRSQSVRSVAMSRRRKRPSKQLQNRLPDDIFFEILERLPVNSLVRFMTVSKSWEASIRNPSFISSYHHHHHDSCSHLVFLPDPFWHPVQTCSLIPETNSTPIPNYNPVLKLRCQATLVGSSEGLICFQFTSALFLWNPFIRTSLKKIFAGEISLNVTPKSRRNPYAIVLGFGFAPKSRDHRIVKLLYNGDHLSDVEIYSLASDSWRRIKPPPTRFIYMNEEDYPSSVYLDGSIYWLAWGDARSYLIFRFDLEDERFEEIAVPSNGINISRRLLVIDGFLVVWLPGYWIDDGKIKVQVYINEESNSGSSSWDTKSVDLPEAGELIFTHDNVTDGHIMVSTKDNRVSVYCGSCDGKNLSFKLKDFKLKDLVGSLAEEWAYFLIPTKKTLFLLDKK